MSKPDKPGEPRPQRAPQDQVRYFADLYRPSLSVQALAAFAAHTRELGLSFAPEELVILAALDTPERVQEFLNTQVYYNNDHASVEIEETTLPPRRVLQTGMAHCFEGAMFAYAVNYMHGHTPTLVVLEAVQDSEHNLVIFEAGRNRLFGCNAHSAFPHLDGRRPMYPTIRGIAESYYPYYYSDRTHNSKDLTLVGFSDPFDLVVKYGVRWMDAERDLWDMYYTYVDDTLTFHYLFDYTPQTHPYPLIRALQSGWIRLTEGSTRSYVSVPDLPRPSQELWNAFWKVYDTRDVRPRGAALAFEKQFFDQTGTTPMDLTDNVEELDAFLARGYRIEQLLTRGM